MVEKKPANGGERVAISYKMPPNIYGKVSRLVYEEKRFSTVSDCITQALLAFVDDHHDRQQMEELVREYLASEEGKEFTRSQVKDVLTDMFSVTRNDTGRKN
ncbi:MAG: hypothetical protein WC342_01370 [Methanoregula sp.]|jgi:Arc/MetJ-type ribon-helix-helix transcriptional regulator